MTKTETLKVYKRFLNALEGTDAVTAVEYYEALLNKLSSKGEDAELNRMIEVQATAKVLKLINRSRIKFVNIAKERNEPWNKEVNEECFKLFDKLKYAWSQYNPNYKDSQANDAYKVLVAKWWTMVFYDTTTIDSTSQRLFLMNIYANKDYGKNGSKTVFNLFDDELAELMKDLQ